MKKTTRYYRNALKAASKEVIDFREKAYSEVAENQLEEGKLDIDKIAKDLNIKWESKNEEEKKKLIIAAKTICLNYEYTEKTLRNVLQLTSLLFIPVEINKYGELFPPEDSQLPWIPREYLEPMCESILSFGKISDLDNFYNMTDSARSNIDTWDKYYKYAKKFFGAVCNTDFEANEIRRGDDKYTFDGKFYVFENDRVIVTHNIIDLYDYLLESEENALYKKLTGGKEEPLRKLIDLDSTDSMKMHVGQMNGEYSLSTSQRNAMNHFCDMQTGDVLAVSGPPGTGKTTLLQSIVANMYVERALKEELAPVIVASSTNNQAVTNIIDSFGKINCSFDENFEQKWIEGTDSFAIYMPSQQMKAEAEKKGYQYTDVNGSGFYDTIESVDNIKASKEVFLKMYNAFYDNELNDIEDCQKVIHKHLKAIDSRREECLNIISSIGKALDKDKTSKTSKQREATITKEIDRINETLEALHSKEQRLKQKRNGYFERFKLWNSQYYSLPWYVRLFKFLRIFKRRISNFIFSFMEEEELSFLNRSMSFDLLIDSYKKQIELLDSEISALSPLKELNKQNISLLNDELNMLKDMVNNLTNRFAKAYEVLPELMKDAPPFEKVNEKTIQELNDLLDKVRYVEFWLSVHYFEARWLVTPNTITENQKGTNYEPVLTTMYQRLAMISPCFVMTLYMLPRNFKTYRKNENRNFYIEGLIDLLIIDEAGQTTLEVSAASFSLAKMAVVVGDEKQIPPVYGIVGAVDRTIAKEQNMIEDYSDFDSLEAKKLSCSSSSIMGRALLCCAYDEYEHGLFLSEHRRCYDEIIEYCNELLYSGRLKPMRGPAAEDKKRSIHDSEGNNIQPMSFVQIDSDTSERVGTSRINKKEATEIANWIIANFETLCDVYSDTNEKEVLAVITPFKAQSELIKRVLKKAAPGIANEVGVGTVHTFQGGEKKVIIFSTVYGKNDGYFFIRTNANLMNVAVSRAKDAFMVFGDLRGFQNDSTSPDGLLKKKVGFYN